MELNGTIAHSDVPQLAIMSRRPSELPIELHEYMISFLDNWDESGTIANCALVCLGRWLPFSRFKLYYVVNLHYRWQWTAFQHLISPSASSSIRGYLGMVREMRIWPYDERPLDKEPEARCFGQIEGQERPWTHLVVLQCAAYLTGLTYINFRDVDWSQTYAKAAALHSGSNYHSLTTLVLWCCTFSDVLQLHRFVTAFPALSELTLDSITLRSLTTGMPSDIPMRGHLLTRLTLSGFDEAMSPISQCLAATALVQNLSYLKWLHSSGVAELGWQRLTDAIDGASLQVLNCSIGYPFRGTCHNPCVCLHVGS